MNLWARLFEKAPPLEGDDARVLQAAKVDAASRRWRWRGPVRITLLDDTPGRRRWAVTTRANAARGNLHVTVVEPGFTVARALKATLVAYDGATIAPIDDVPDGVLQAARAYGEERSWIWHDPIRVTRVRAADGTMEWVVYTNANGLGLNLLLTVRAVAGHEVPEPLGFVVVRGVQATCSHSGDPAGRGPDELVPDEVLASAKAYCATRSWPWLEPIAISSVGADPRRREWTIVTNWGCRGMNVSLRVREPDFAVVESGFLPR